MALAKPIACGKPLPRQLPSDSALKLVWVLPREYLVHVLAAGDQRLWSSRLVLDDPIVEEGYTRGRVRDFDAKRAVADRISCGLPRNDAFSDGALLSTDGVRRRAFVTTDR